MFNDLWYQCLIFFFGVLLIQDAVRLFLESATTETVIAVKAVHAVIALFAVPIEHAADHLIIFF